MRLEQISLRVISVLIVLGLFGAATPPAAAQNHSVHPEVQALAKAAVTRGLQDYRDGAARLEAVDALRNYCIALNRIYPRNSPKEVAWIEAELAAGDSRMLRAAQSAEYGRRIAENFLESCLAGTEGYLNGRGNKLYVLYLLIFEISRFAPDAAYFAKLNGVDQDGWGFIVLDNVSGTLALIGMQEASESTNPKR